MRTPERHEELFGGANVIVYSVGACTENAFCPAVLDSIEINSLFSLFMPLGSLAGSCNWLMKVDCVAQTLRISKRASFLTFRPGNGADMSANAAERSPWSDRWWIPRLELSQLECVRTVGCLHTEHTCHACVDDSFAIFMFTPQHITLNECGTRTCIVARWKPGWSCQ